MYTAKKDLALRPAHRDKMLMVNFTLTLEFVQYIMFLSSYLRRGGQ